MSKKKSAPIDTLIPDMASKSVDVDNLDFSSAQLRDALEGEEILSEDIFGEVDAYVDDAEREEAARTAQERQAENQDIATKNVKKKKKAKWYHLLAAILLLLVIIIFVGWHLVPRHIMKVAVLDKTVLSYSLDNNIIKDNVYRKHQGLYWILEQQKYVKADGTYYDFKEDYYGPMLDEEGSYKKESVYLKSMPEAPDLMYISDAYGLIDDTFGYFHGDDPSKAGISQDDMSAISYAYESGATIVAETALFSSPMSESVYSQLTTLCGVTPTQWVGRYIFDLEDFSDVPDWAPPMYEQQEGVEWRFTGPGILLVSRDGKIIILEQNTDFNTKNLLKVYINSDKRKEFINVTKANFYNWFELVEPNYGTEQIATFEFDLNAVGMEKIKNVIPNKITTPRFCAITRKVTPNHAPVYFFSGDFNDYTSGHRYGRFLLANQIYKLFSFDRQGDMTNFYWNFYNPLMRKILKDIRTTEYVDNSAEEHREVSRVHDDTFQVMKDGEWKDIDVKAVAINAIAPGTDKYSRDMIYYDKLVSLADKLGANCLCAKTLLPPEFYSSVVKHNRSSTNKLYILQTVATPTDLHPEDYISEEGQKLWEEAIQQTIAAVHGDCSAKNEFMDEAVYFTDASAYLLGITIDPTLDEKTCFSARNAEMFDYKGTYTGTQTGMSALCAFLYDTAQKYNYENYEYYTPIAVRSYLTMIKDTGYALSNQAYLFTGIADESVAEYYYNDVMYDSSFLERTTEKTKDEYDSLYEIFTNVKKQMPAYLLSGISFSNTNAVFKSKATTEVEQGNKITNLLAAARDSELLGTCIYDLNDTWYDVSDDMYSSTVPIANKYMWHNVCDETEMTGLVAAEAATPDKASLVLSDDDRAQRISVYYNEAYMYITIELLEEIDFSIETMFLGIDTYQRNDGEYFYSSKFTMNSLSGMEFVLEFKSKQDVTLYCIPSYNRTKNHAYTEEAYSGKFNRVAKLSYGGFNVEDNQFYQTSSTIYIRLPWTWLNVTDPSNRLVMADEGPLSKQPRTMTTNGMLLSIMIGENATGDNMYSFPQSKHDPGYKMFKWAAWEKVSYSLREKESYTIVQDFYNDNQAESEENSQGDN